MRVIHFAGAEVMGGLLVHVTHLVREQCAAGLEVLVVLSPTAAIDEAARECGRAGATVERLAVMGVTDLSGLSALGRLVGRERPDLFHMHLSSPIEAIPAILSARLAGAARIVTTEHAPTWFPLEKSYSRAAKKGAGRFVSRVIAVCRSDAAFLRERFGVPESRIRVIHNGVPEPAAHEARSTARQRLSLPPGAGPLIGCVGALEVNKGLLDLLEGIPQAGLPLPAVALAGEGSLAGALDDRARDLRVTLIRTGRLAEVGSFLAALDIFVLPSHQEAMPLALLEAMWAGLPIISTRVGGIPEAIEDGVTGLLVDAGRPDQIASALRRLHADDAGAARLGQAARAAAQARFSVSRMARQVEGLYREVLAEESRPAGSGTA